MGDIERYRSSSAEPAWARGASERAVQREGRLLQQIIEVKQRVAEQAIQADRDVALAYREIFEATTEKVNAARDKNSDPRVRQVMEIVDRELLERHKQQLLGYYLLVGEQFALQIARDITPVPPPPPQSFWQHVAVAVFGG